MKPETTTPAESMPEGVPLPFPRRITDEQRAALRSIAPVLLRASQGTAQASDKLMRGATDVAPLFGPLLSFAADIVIVTTNGIALAAGSLAVLGVCACYALCEDGADELSKADAKAPTDSGEPACSAPKEVQ